MSAIKVLRFGLAATAIAVSGAAKAEGNYDTSGRYAGTYFCQGEAAGGVGYDDIQKKWNGYKLSQDTKYVVKVVSNEIVRPEDGSAKYMSYDLSVVRHGTSLEMKCENLLSGGIYKDGAFLCVTPFNVFKVNLGNLRYLDFYMAGYVDGQDDMENTPAVTAGTCSKIE